MGAEASGQKDKEHGAWGMANIGCAG